VLAEARDHPAIIEASLNGTGRAHGINRSTIRAALRELRAKLGIAHGDDVLEGARMQGVLAADMVPGGAEETSALPQQR